MKIVDNTKSLPYNSKTKSWDLSGELEFSKDTSNNILVEGWEWKPVLIIDPEEMDRPKCPHCGSTKVSMFDSDNDICGECNKYFPAVISESKTPEEFEYLLNESEYIINESDRESLGEFDYICGPGSMDVDQYYPIDKVRECLSEARILLSNLKSPVAWYVKRISSNENEKRCRLGPFFNLKEAEEWTDENHILIPLFENERRKFEM